MKLLTVGITVLVALGVSSAGFANAHTNKFKLNTDQKHAPTKVAENTEASPNINVAAESVNKNPQSNAQSTDKSQTSDPKKSGDQQKASEQQKPNDDSEND